MSLPTKAVDRLFERLGVTYGAQWHRMWDGMPIADVKSSWAHELSAYAQPEKMAAIAWALENLPERCPNVIEFRNLCRNAPKPEAPRLPEPKADPERLKAELAKLRGPAIEAARGTYDHKAWAKSLIAKSEAGFNVPAVCLRFAKEALANKAGV